MATNQSEGPQCRRVSVRVEWDDGTADVYEAAPPKYLSYECARTPFERSESLKLTLTAVGIAAHMEGVSSPRGDRE